MSNSTGYPSSVPGDRDDDLEDRTAVAKGGHAQSVQPGTAKKGRDWQSRSPDPNDKDDQLQQALKDSFPASDPPQSAQPGVTGWDLKDEKGKTKAS